MKLDPNDKSFSKNTSGYKEMDKLNATGCSPFLVVIFGPYILYSVTLYWGYTVEIFGWFFGTIVYIALLTGLYKMYLFFMRMKL